PDLDSNSLSTSTIDLQIAINLIAKILIRAKVKHPGYFRGSLCRADRFQPPCVGDAFRCASKLSCGKIFLAHWTTQLHWRTPFGVAYYKRQPLCHCGSLNVRMFAASM